MKMTSMKSVIQKLAFPLLAGGMFTLRFLVGLDYQIAKISKVNKN